MNVLTYGLTVTGIGLLIVFVGLGILIGLLTLMAVIFKAIDKKKAARKAELLNAVTQEVPAEIEPEEVVDDAQDVGTDELIAVIAAAIAAYDGGSRNLVVKSVRRVNGWKNAARSEQGYKF